MEFTKLKKYIGGIASEYENMLREQMENCDKEQAAAIKIQKCYRGYKGRKLYLVYKYFVQFMKNQICLLGCFYLLKKMKREKLENQMLTHLSDNALKIQKTYRGFYSRKYIHDFYQRRREIAEIDRHMKEQQQKMLIEVEKRRQQQLMYDNRLKEEKIEKVTKKLHHLVSTKAQRGVYNPKIENIIIEQVTMIFRTIQNKKHNKNEKKKQDKKFFFHIKWLIHLQKKKKFIFDRKKRIFQKKRKLENN